MKASIINSRERFENIQRAVRERDQFLEEHPHLLPFQRDIERRLKNATSMENRITILSGMMEEKLHELHEACLEVKRIWDGIH